jgi:hypothetical protein
MAEFLGAALLTAILAVGQSAPAVPPAVPAAADTAAVSTAGSSLPKADSAAATVETAGTLHSAAADSSVSAPDSLRADSAKRAASVIPSAPRHSSKPRYPGAPLLLQVPVVDAPSGFREPNAAFGFHSPSMRQSLLWNAAATQLGVQTLAWTWERQGWTGFAGDFAFWISMGAFSFATSYLPPGGSWLHEEWHRSVLTRRGADSRNGVYDFDFGAAIIKVDGVQDADLAALKRDHPADFIRLMSAGIEGQTEAHRHMRRMNFFLGRSSRHDRFIWWVDGLNSTFYLAACANGWIDEELEGDQERETSMADRDFTGPDFTAWVHDLRRPSLDYADGPRGRSHPSGTPGYRRYIGTGDLTASEQDYLDLQAWLSLLNFVSPQYWGPDWMPGVLPWDGQGVLWNAGMAHHLTPFGYSLAADLLLRRGKWSWAFTAHAYASSDKALPGLKAELVRYPVLAGRKVLYLTGSASAWLQPDGLLFNSDGVLPGGALLAGAAVPFVGGLEIWAEADAKSEGWVPGNVYLDPAVQARAGLAWRM